MTDREIIKKSFEDIFPSEELIKKTLSQAGEKNHKGTRTKRAVTAAFAACAVLALGVTAAAAGGYIDFDAVFGNYIKVPDSELAASMVSCVSDLRYRVSDKNYKFTVKGAVGDDRNAMVILELSRTDGTPVTEHFNFDTDEISLQSIHDGFEIRSVFEALSGSCGYGYNINEKGNIEMIVHGNCKESINGKIFKVCGENFYPEKQYFNKLNTENIYYGLNNGKWGYYKIKTNTPSDFDDSALRLLDLKWEISFSYKPSEDSIKTLTCKELSQEFIYRQDIRETEGKENNNGSISYYAKPELLAVTENNARPELIEIGAVNGRIIFNYKPNEYEITENNGPCRYSIITSQNSEAYIIYKDGTHITVQESNSSGSENDENIHKEVTLSYYTDDWEKTFIELDKVEAFYINGTIYNLE